MRTCLLCLMVALAAADAAEPETCTPPRPGVWVPMAVAGGPQLGDVADVKTGFLGRTQWWLWDAFQPLTDSHVFDARCNVWRRTRVAQGSTLPRQLNRRCCVLFGDNALAVYSPTWEEPQEGPAAARSLGVFVLEGERLQWTNVTPTQPVIDPNARVFSGDGLLVAWDERAGRGAVFTLATRRWEFFSAPPPLVGKGYDCSWIQDGAWLVANPQGVFRFDLGSKTWSTLLEPKQPMPMPDLGACLRSSSASGLSVAMPKPVYAPGRALFVIESAGTSAWELPSPAGNTGNVVTAGNTLWLAEGSGAGRFQRYDRGAKKWVSVSLPKGLDARRAYLSEVQGQAALVELAPESLPAPRAAPVHVSLWNGKRFGPPISLGTGAAFRDEVQAALGGLVAIDGETIRALDLSGRERLRLPGPPRWLAYQDFGSGAFVTWGEMRTLMGNDCNNPFHPRAPDPRMPICDPSRVVAYTQISPGGFVLLRASED
jgi:hypothetical protein